MNATPRPRAFVRDMSDTTTSKEAFCEKYTVELQDDALRSVLCRIADVEICPEHRWTAKELAELFANAVNNHDAMRDALELIVAWNRSGGASTLEEGRELTYQKAKAALALAKGGKVGVV